jgi:DNA-directed RNA polymerase subunit F
MNQNCVEISRSTIHTANIILHSGINNQKDELILEGDSNTGYFHSHSIANGRQWKKLVDSLVHDEGTTEE